jgi:N-methylhydantoinase A
MDLETDNMAWRVGVDTGGTFTDLLLADPTGQIRVSCKVLSTPDDPGRAVLAGIDRLLDLYEDQAGQRQRIGQVIHGSTVATNALLEGKADAAAMITTAGFEDLLLLARQNRPELYALSPQRSAPPIPRAQTIGVDERLAYDGSVITPLTQHEIDRVLQALEDMQVASAAICLLHSYANDEHEYALAQAIRAKLPAMHLTVSSELLPELREYERAATCAANAVVAPTMARYIGKLDETLGNSRLRIMASGGGTLPPRTVIERPIETVMSGPAGGVVGALAMNSHRIITFDMGGTSTDVSLCDHGPTRTNETTINGLPIRLPIIDIHTVGAGGGSIAWIDDGGALRVGPRSAGAEPGPACYGKQGENPCIATVTDAHAVLGHLRDGRQLGEALAIDTAAARYAIGTIAERLNLSIEDTAEGILRVADAAMARAIQSVSVQRGHDAREYALFGFGGAGGLHACRLAELLGMTHVVIPVHGGLLSAYGMLAAPVRYAFSHAVLKTVMHDGERYEDPTKDTTVKSVFATLVDRANRALDYDGLKIEDCYVDLFLDLRFAGQSYELTSTIDDEFLVIDNFLHQHRLAYGYAPEGKPIEILNARISVTSPEIEVFNTLDMPGKATELPRGYAIREQMQPRLTIVKGPLVIEEYAATTVVPNGWFCHVLDDGALSLRKEGAERN